MILWLVPQRFSHELAPAIRYIESHGNTALHSRRAVIYAVDRSERPIRVPWGQRRVVTIETRLEPIVARFDSLPPDAPEWLLEPSPMLAITFCVTIAWRGGDLLRQPSCSVTYTTPNIPNRQV